MAGAATVNIENHDELLVYLKQSGRIEAAEQPHFTTLQGGISNRTVLVERQAGQSWVIKQALAKLRVDVDWFSDPSRIEREAAAMKYLAQLAPPGSIIPLIFLDQEHHLLAMQAVAQRHENFKSRLLTGQIERNEIEQFARLLGAIHRNAWNRRDELAEIFDNRAYFESLRLEPYYAYAAQQLPLAASPLRDLIDQTRNRRITLVHGDYSPKNILIHDGKLILLDHEVIHWGDPAFDVGFSFAHLLSKAHHRPAHRETLTAASHLYWQTYSNEIQSTPWANDLEPFTVRHSLACLVARVAGRSKLEYLSEAERIVQQRVACELLIHPPATVPDMIDRFIGAV